MADEQNHEHPVSGGVKIVLFVSAMLILCNYYYLYFYDFSQGVSGANGYFGFIKFLGLAFFYVAMLTLRIRRSLALLDFLIFMFLFFFTVIFSLKALAIGRNGLLFANMLICAIPFFIFKRRLGRKGVIFFLDSCLLVLVSQVFIDAMIYANDLSLWNNKAFIGGLGNPTSFGFLSVILIAYVLFVKKLTIYPLMAVFVLSAGVLMTSSMLSVLLLLGIFMAWFFRGKKIFTFLFLSLAGLIILFVTEPLLSEHLAYKLRSLVSIFSGEIETQSASVSLRVQMHSLFIEKISEGPLQVMFFGYSGPSYYAADSQYLTYIGSFGFAASAIFFVTLFLKGLQVYRKEDSFCVFSMLVIFLYLIAFLSNRVLDYYPIPLFLFIVMMLGNRHAAQRPRCSSSSQRVFDI